MTITVSARFGIPLSTTHTIGSAIMGVGATRRLSAVRWGIAQNIVVAWILTFPDLLRAWLADRPLHPGLDGAPFAESCCSSGQRRPR